jgi:hypothetical protein
MATTLKRWLVGVTAGPVKPSTLTWKGKSRKAPDNPPTDITDDTQSAT